MDATGADFFASVDTIRDKLKANPVPIEIPIGSEANFVGVVDLITMKSEIYKDDTGREIEIGEIPDNLKADAEKWRANLVENIAEHDEEVMMKYLDGEELTEEEIRKTIRKATISLAINPVLCSASYKNKGVQPLLNAINDFMPSPFEALTHFSP